MERYEPDQMDIDAFYRALRMQEAAPDMYRALKGLLEAFVGFHVYSYDGAWDTEIKAAQAALAKADGE